MTFSSSTDTDFLPLDYFDLELLCYEIRDHLFVSPDDYSLRDSKGAIVPPLSIRVDDVSLFRQLIPAQEYRKWMNAGYHQMFLLSFALRHQLAKLSLMAHAHALNTCPSASADAHVEGMSRLLQSSIHEALLVHGHLVSPEFWLKGSAHTNRFPIIVSSALGCHVFFEEAGFCRSCCGYTGAQCGAATDAIFCDAHTSDTWWLPHANETPSSDAKMSLFYSAIDNVAQYDELALEKMVDNFWKKVSTSPDVKIADEASITRSLKYFHIADRNALQELGMNGMKRLFFREAQRRHPDAGGSGDAFIELKQHYEHLHNWLAFQQE